MKIKVEGHGRTIYCHKCYQTLEINDNMCCRCGEYCLD